MRTRDTINYPNLCEVYANLVLVSRAGRKMGLCSCGMASVPFSYGLVPFLLSVLLFCIRGTALEVHLQHAMS